jgi:hypothetical protein
MRLKLTLLCTILLTLVVMVLAQEPPKMPTPGPEQQRLKYFVGKWNYDFTMKASPYGPAGKVTGTDQNEMMPGGFFLISHSRGKGTFGELRGLAIFGYDGDDSVYTYYSVNNWGEKEISTGTVEADTWIWNADSKMGGKTVKTRFTIKEISKTSYTMKFDAAGDDGEWQTIMEGKATKTK